MDQIAWDSKDKIHAVSVEELNWEIQIDWCRVVSELVLLLWRVELLSPKITLLFTLVHSIPPTLHTSGGITHCCQSPFLLILSSSRISTTCEERMVSRINLASTFPIRFRTRLKFASTDKGIQPSSSMRSRRKTSLTRFSVLK